MSEKKYVVVQRDEFPLSKVVNDCDSLGLCVPTTKGESLKSILQKLCKKPSAISSSSYTLPSATEDRLGGVKVGDGLGIENGILFVKPTSFTQQPSDWLATEGVTRILNKPSIPTQYTDAQAVTAIRGILSTEFSHTSNNIEINKIDWSKIINVPETIGAEADPIWESEKGNYYTKVETQELFYSIDNPEGYISSFTETDSIALAKTITINGETQTLADNPSFTISVAGVETDPVWNSEKSDYFTKDETDVRYLQSFTETDAIALAKTITINGDTQIVGDNPEFTIDIPEFIEEDPIWESEKSNYYTKTEADSNFYPSDNPDGFISSFTETDPIFSASPVSGITTTNISHWDSAYGWGNHALAGYLTSFTETDPIFGASAASGISGTDITHWNTAYSWGNHALAGYLTSFTETDPTVSSVIKNIPASADATTNKYLNWNGSAYIRKQIAYSELSGTPTIPSATSAPSGELLYGTGAGYTSSPNATFNGSVFNINGQITNTQTATQYAAILQTSGHSSGGWLSVGGSIVGGFKRQAGVILLAGGSGQWSFSSSEVATGAQPDFRIRNEQSSTIPFYVSGSNDNIIIPISELQIGSATDLGAYKLQVTGDSYLSGTTISRGQLMYQPGLTGDLMTDGQLVMAHQNSNTFQLWAKRTNYLSGSRSLWLTANDFTFNAFNGSAYTTLALLNNSGEFILGSTTDLGAYKLQVTGDVIFNQDTNNNLSWTNSTQTLTLTTNSSGVNGGITISKPFGLYPGLTLSNTSGSGGSIKFGGGSSSGFYPMMTFTMDNINNGGSFLSIASSDTGSSALFRYDSRLSGGPLTVKPLFEWGSWTSTYMQIKANGTLLLSTLNDSTGVAKMVTTTNGVLGYQAIPSGGGGGGITRTITSISATATLGTTALTDYIYICTSTFSLTMPTAVGNTNRYTFKNAGTGIITLNRTGTQTIEEATSITINPGVSIELISDGTNWWII